DQPEISIPEATRARIEKSHHALLKLLEDRVPIYGVTTGFGDSGNRTISAHQSEQLQENLVAYLLCGTGPVLSPEASRAILTIRLNSMCRGHSGISLELVERMQMYLQNDWLPVIPREGSLGASGDLVPLAYLAQVMQGQGEIYCDGKVRQTAEVLREKGIEPYKLKAKEGLAMVNGTSAMAGLFSVNLNHARFLLDLLCMNTSWLTLALQGRTEAFGALVNEQAKTSVGQGAVALKVRRLLEAEGYQGKPLAQIGEENSKTREWVQDRYSLRCVPQIAGPIFETLTLLEGWLGHEINSATDNPLIGEDGSLANGGNFYGGYLSHGMDYLKISLAHIADTVDRQVAYIVDDKSNRGLPANLADWNNLPPEERHLHHGLKGLHQSVGAITSEIMAKATPGGIFSRSSESHNQDKVSLGMSAAVQCSEMLEPLFTIMSIQSIVLAQALDLRGVKLTGKESSEMYSLIRGIVPFVGKDQSLGANINKLRENFKELSARRGKLGAI
ncbi:MAG: HAL/PAL/TAL family ammonia-lyase, partial [Bdellovibrionales bacterium]